MRGLARDLRSDDGGDTWRSQPGVRCNDNTLISAGDNFFAGCADGSYATTNRGESWSAVEEAPGGPATGGDDVYWIVDGGTVLRWNAETRAAEPVPPTRGLPFTGGPPALAGVDGRFLYGVSSRGSAWIDVEAPAPAWTTTNLPGYSRVALVFGAGEGYALSNSISRRLSDHSFEHVADLDFDVADAIFHDGRLVAASQTGIHTSDDGGVTWSNELPVRFEAGTVLAAQGSRLFAASQAGFWVREGDGAWAEIEALSHGIDRVLAFGDAVLTTGSHGAQTRQGARSEWLPIDLDTVYGLTSLGDHLFAHDLDGELYRSRDAGRSFDALPSPGRTSFLVDLDGVLVALFDRSLYRSTDDGQTFIEIGAVPQYEYNGKALVRIGDALLYADGPDLFRSVDDGRSWERAVASPGFQNNATAVDGAVFVTDFSGNLSRSTDLAASWVDVALPSEGRIATTASGNDTLYIAINSADPFEGSPFEGSIYFTRDHGDTWERLDPADGPFTHPLGALTLRDDVLYIGTVDAGLWAAHLSDPTLATSE